jgi:photosystem II stability/assembly factor-like uncharacterized protein
MISKWTGFLAAAAIAAAPAVGQAWRQIGPTGGTVISLEADPHNAQRLYLGTSDGHVFTSNDEGGHWQLLSRIGTGRDDVVTHILVDPRNSNHLYASTWTLYSGGGGVYRSSDGGRTWNLIALAHETVRALAQSPSNPHVFAAGSLTGVYLSKDDGATWNRITPEHHEDLRNFDSVAFDPRDQNVIYVGTYHLPWKTTDGGKNWAPISKGMIDDSDVMSIIVDPANPTNVHATACSGIYHSVNGADTWAKYKGIPFVFRRTQLIRQDPKHPDVLYAGTTSGLWKTVNESDWKRITPGDWVINAMVIDPQNPDRLIIGTEREGVQVSENAGATFVSSNSGFQHQHIEDVAIDRTNPSRALVVLTFDTDPFLATGDGGTTWAPLGPGLKRTQLRHVYAAPAGWWVSLSSGGFMKYEEGQGKWVRAGLYEPDSAVRAAAATSHSRSRSRRATAAARPAPRSREFVAFQVNDMIFARDAWFAATAGGVLVSHDNGATWKSAGSDSFVRQPAQSLEASLDGSQVWAIAGRSLLYSNDSGRHWDAKDVSFASAGNLRLHRAGDSNLFITTNMGLYVSNDAGRTWTREAVRELQFQDVAGSRGALIVSLQKQGLLESFDGGKSWQHVNDPRADGFFPAVQAERNGSLVAVSATEGLLRLDPAVSASNGGAAGRSEFIQPGGAQQPR